MLNRTFLFLILFALAGTSGPAMEKDEIVTILLNNGDKIEAQITAIGFDQVEFKAKSSKKAYEYGEILNIERITGIKLKNGMTLSVKEYQAYLKEDSKEVPAKEVEARPAISEPVRNIPPGADPQYEMLKSKPISEMTQNEFEYFLMMKEKERQAGQESETAEVKQPPVALPLPVAAKESIPDITPAVVLPESPANYAAVSPVSAASVDDLAGTLIDANLAPDFLKHVTQKTGRGEALTTTEATLSEMIRNHPKWLDKLDDVKYLDRVSFKALERAYLYNPDELQNQLGLRFDRDAEINFADLMEQLHRKTGDEVRISDFRILVDLFGESGGRAVKDLLQNYEAWQFATQGSQQFTDKN
ncbi:MAG TPA: hypothetical protein VGA99_02485 [bacterium]